MSDVIDPYPLGRRINLVILGMHKTRGNTKDKD